jgi:hypothetical protein
MTTPRMAAKARGDRFYETGNPCKSGHVARRTTGNGNCTACTAEFKATPATRRKSVEYTLRWRAAHPEAARASLRKWQLENPLKMKAARKRHKDKMKAEAAAKAT